MAEEKPDLLIISDLDGTLRDDNGRRNIALGNVYHAACQNYNVKAIMYTMSSKADFAEPILRKLYYNEFFLPASLDTRVVLKEGIYDIKDLKAPIDEICVLNPKNLLLKDVSESYVQIGQFWQMNLEHMLLVDDTGVNRDAAFKAGCMTCGPNPERVLDIVRHYSHRRLAA